MADRILFLYPNKEGYAGVPNGFALLSACLKDNGFDVKCFDTTFLGSLPATLFNREKHGGVQKVQHEEYWGAYDEADGRSLPELFLESLREYNPIAIAVTLTDVNLKFAVDLIKSIPIDDRVPVIAGGPTPTLDPDVVMNFGCFDAVCVGEGEGALVEFCQRVREEKSFEDVRNLWVRTPTKVLKNTLRPFVDLNTLPNQDWSIFDSRHHFKPYCGKFYRTGFFEFARGCAYNCSFCCNSKLRETYCDLGKYVRVRSVEACMSEMEDLKRLHDLELIFFIDDNFLGMKKDRLEDFCSQYRRRIGLPFYLQTRPETVTKEKIQLLKDAGVSTIAIGVEHGDEEYRKKHLNRKMKNEVLYRAFGILHDLNIRSTANIILGMPHDKETMMAETIRVMRELSPKSYSLNYYAPYRGTKMRAEAVSLGLIGENHIVEETNICLDLPEFPRERIIFYYENFAKYMSGELVFK